MSKQGDLRCSCGRRIVYVKLDGTGRCHICGFVDKEVLQNQKDNWDKPKEK